jgi:endonuclease G, mitochondrial
MSRRFLLLIARSATALLLVLCATVIARCDSKNGQLPCSDQIVQKHNALGLPAQGPRVCFEAYISEFQSAVPDHTRALGVPRFVAYEVDKGKPPPGRKPRPSQWYTVPELFERGLAPSDASYATTVAFRRANANWYQRGHLAPKFLADRLGKDAGRYTHNVVNAVPQRAEFNRGPWFELECQTGAWANRYHAVWVIAGPVFLDEHPSAWLEPDGVMPVAIPDALFKLVARKANDGTGYRVLGFVYPQESPAYADQPWDSRQWRTAVARIQSLTGLKLIDPLIHFDEAPQQELWPTSYDDYDEGCHRFVPD